jgi:multidrug efflux system outer membrane protein
MRALARPFAIAALAGVLASPLTGCVSLDPAWRRPDAPVPAVSPSGPAYPQAGEPAATPPARWREVFTDPQLKAVIEQALINNRDLRIAVANIQAARAQYRVQRAAELPAITAQAGESYTRTPGAIAGIPGLKGPLDSRVYSASVGFSAYELDLFGHIRSLTRAQQQQYFAAEEARRTAQISLVAEVAGAWLTYGADSALLQIARDTEVSGQASLTLTQQRLAGGIASGLDVSQAQTIVEQARVDVARETTQLAQDRNALDLLVGATVDEALLPTGQAGEVLREDALPAGVRSQVLLARPDVVQAEDQLKAANADIGAARAAFFPSLSLTTSDGSASTALSTLFRAGTGTWSFAPQLAAPIFEGGRNRANLALAKAQRDAAVATYEKAIQTAFREVADALAERGTIDEQLAGQQALTQASADALRLSTARYERGSDTYLNELVSQRALYAAQQGLVATRLAASTNLVTLYKALGGGWD